MGKHTRRDFLGVTTATAAGSLVNVNFRVASAADQSSPNDTVRLGLIGCGHRGNRVMNNLQKLPNVRVAGVCDVHSTRVAKARQKFDGSKVIAYRDYRKMLENKDIDAVVVATPGHWHVLPTIHACQAGKDVYVEKPLATSIGEGRAAVDAARKYDRIVQIGTQQRSWEHYRRAVEIVQSGKLGEISEVKVWDYDYFYPGFGSPPDGEPPKEIDWVLYLGPSPRKPYNPNRYDHHYWFFDYGNGWQVDWAVHHYDIVNWAMGCGEPIAANGMGGFMCFEGSNTEWPDTFSGTLKYGPCPAAKKGFLLQYTFRAGCRRDHRSHCKIFHGTEASMILDRGGYTVTAESRNGKKLGEKLASFRGSAPNHEAVFVANVRNHTRPQADVEEGHRGGIPGHLMNISWRVGRQIRWDGEREQVIDDPEANTLVTKKYRKPWELHS